MNQLQFLRLLVVFNGIVPLLVLGWDAYRGQLGANAVNYALHVTGILSLIFIVASLIMTPLRWVSGWSGWIAFRRALGLYGFAYAALHFAIYVGLDRQFNMASTWSELWSRRFLQVGTAALLLMIPLAVTSTNAMLHRLGSKKWKLLHRSAYLVAILGVIHYYMLVKSDIRQPVAFAVVVTALLGARAARHYYELRMAARKALHSSSATQLKQAMKRRKYWKGELKVIGLFQETPDVKTFRLAAKDGGALPFEYLPGQYMNLQLQIDGKKVNRSYTIASSPTRRDACELSIKREANGLVSRFLHDTVRVGDTIEIGAPAGKFVYTGSQSKEVLLIAGGVGITPLMSIARYLTDRSWDGDIYFLIVAKTEADIIFCDELALMQIRHPKLHVCKTLTRSNPASAWNGHRGRPSAELLNTFVPSHNRMPVYLCGPEEMMAATKQLLMSVGVAEPSIQLEAFVSPGVGGSSSIDDSEQNQAEDLNGQNIRTDAGEARRVSFSKAKIDCEVTVDMSILDAAEQYSVELPFECRSGICGQCKVRLLSGNVSMETQDALSPSERKQGFILACQAHPTTDVVVEA
jgi:glycine betaine catabolism B